MGTLRDATIKALPGLIGGAIVSLGGRAIDALSPPKDSKELFKEYYQAIDSSNLPRTEMEARQIVEGVPPSVVSQAPATPVPTPATPPNAYNAEGRDAMEIMGHEIDTAISSLASAKGHTRCSLCRATLNELEEEVREKTGFIRESTKLWNAMQDLKAKGALPRDIAWSGLTDEQKDLVKQHANK
ncbi:MAG: hypothetical protein WCR85_00120 [Sphaerochaeta sp.]